MVDRRVDHLTGSDGASAPKIGGVALTTFFPPVRRAGRGVEHARRSLASLCRIRRGESVPTRLQQGFPGKAPTTAARARPLRV